MKPAISLSESREPHSLYSCELKLDFKRQDKWCLIISLPLLLTGFLIFYILSLYALLFLGIPDLGDPRIFISQTAREFHSLNSKTYSIMCSLKLIQKYDKFPFPKKWREKKLRGKLLDKTRISRFDWLLLMLFLPNTKYSTVPCRCSFN